MVSCSCSRVCASVDDSGHRATQVVSWAFCRQCRAAAADAIDHELQMRILQDDRDRAPPRVAGREKGEKALDSNTFFLNEKD